MKRLKSIPGKWMLTIMLALLLTTCYFVLNSRVYLLEQKEQLVQQEQKLIAQEEAEFPSAHSMFLLHLFMSGLPTCGSSPLAFWRSAF